MTIINPNAVILVAIGAIAGYLYNGVRGLLWGLLAALVLVLIASFAQWWSDT